MMLREQKQTVIALTAIALFAVGCSAEPRVETPGEPQVEMPAETAPAMVAESVLGPASTLVEGHNGVVEGLVRDSSGAPVAGAFVKLTNEERRLTFMHISQEGGRYAADRLPAGSYMVQAVGGDFESAWSAPVEIGEAGTGHMEVSLNVERAPYLEPAWTRRAPEYNATLDHIPDGQVKDILSQRCVACHTEARIISRHVNYETWGEIMDDMRLRAGVLGIPAITEEEAEIVSTYLAETYPALDAPDPNSRFPFELQPEGARNYRVVQYELEDPLVENHDIAVDPWGVGWSNQRRGGKLGNLNPVSYEFGEVELPPNQTGLLRPGNPQITTDGIMWLAEAFGNRWLTYDIANDNWTEYPFPSDQIRGPAYANTMAFHPDGTVWSSGPGAARRFDPATGEWDSWDTPSWNQTGMNPGGYGISIAGDGRAWMPMNQVDRIARFDPDSGDVVEFEIPVDGVDYPRRMDNDPDGNIWIATWSSGKVLRIDYKTDQIDVIDPPMEHNGVYAMDFDQSSGDMWTTLHTRDIISRYNPETEEWLNLPLPQAETDSRRVEVDQNNPNRVWWSTVAYQARIGFIELLDEDS
jgi:streptogramin lyase